MEQPIPINHMNISPKEKIILCLEELNKISNDFYTNGCNVQDFQIYRMRSYISGIEECVKELN